MVWSPQREVFWSFCSCDWLVLLVKPKGKEGGVGDLGDLKTNTWQITDGMSGTTESSNEHLVVIVNKTHSTVLWNVGSDFLTVLFELNSNALTHGGVGLLSFDTDLLDDDTGSVRCSSERLLPFSSLVSFLVSFIGPSKEVKKPVRHSEY